MSTTESTNTENEPEANDEKDSNKTIGNVKMDPGGRWTSNVEILLIEAELMDDGLTLKNPAMPINQKTKKKAMDELPDGRRAPWQHITEYPHSHR